MTDGLVTRSLLRRETYRDSVELMRVAAELEALPGIERAAALMATSANRELLEQAGFAASGADAVNVWADARPSDLLIAVRGSGDAAEAALAHAASLLAGTQRTDRPSTPGASANGNGAELPRTLGEAVADLPGANLVMISTPGPYAAAEGLKALKRGLHVFCFSDNVALSDEVRLKRLAADRGLLFMGPDCGTAVIDGVPLGFANAVRRGRIGLVGASGTGLQEVMCLLDAAGQGISQVIGVGSHDLSPEVGGIMMRAGLALLGADSDTDVIVAISKPPDAAIAAALLADVRNLAKPVVVCFLGNPFQAVGNVHSTATLEEAAIVALRLRDLSPSPSPARGGEPPSSSRPVTVPTVPAAEEWSSKAAMNLAPPSCAGKGSGGLGRRRVLGLFSGGTLCSEAEIVLRAEGSSKLAYELIDLGDDRFTVGRPHPMIDPRDRAMRIEVAALDPTVAVILLDVVLGYGSHADPAGALATSISTALATAEAAGRSLVVVASFCGASVDPQGLEPQRATLGRAGAHLAASNAAAARLAGRFALGDGTDE